MKLVKRLFRANTARICPTNLTANALGTRIIADQRGYDAAISTNPTSLTSLTHPTHPTIEHPHPVCQMGTRKSRTPVTTDTTNQKPWLV